MIHKPDLAHVAHAIALAGAIFVQGPLPVFGQESALSRCTVAMGAIAPDERIKACSLALQSASPSSAAIVHNFRAVAWHDKYDLDRAIADYGDAVRLNPNYANAFNNRGIAWQAKGDLDRAIADHSQAIRADPGDNSGAYRFRSIAWRLKGEHDRAIADASEAIRLYPDYTAAYVARGLAYEEKRDIARARADYVQALAQPAKYPSGPQAHRDATQYLAALDSRSAVSIREGVTGPTFKRRVALVIGNSQYAWIAALSNPINDATDMAAALRKLGFDVVERKNIGRRDMDLAIGEFSRKLDGADLALFF